MGRHSCCYKQKLRKGLWSPEEDEKLIKHITKYGHGCWSSVPKLAVLETSKSNEKSRGGSEDGKITEGGDSEKGIAIPTPPAHGFFLDRPNIGFSGNGNTNFHNPNATSSDMISEFNSSLSPAVFPSMSSPILTASSTRIKPSISLPSVGSFDVNGAVHNWNSTGTFSNNGSTSNGSSNSIELQSNGSFFENQIFSWGPESCIKSEKEAEIHRLEGEPEDIKWSEYLQTPFLLSAALQNQTAQDIYNGTKPETQFGTDGSSTNWHQNQHQQHPSQAADLYNKHFQRLSATFGHYS
ncbi:myb domain protein 86 [Actinidia rufa]|uniref:Myb domain protein 86 n=1 Tax=Actinidia rufa TaxID=165716 RepID=A0A7J0F6M9_9ERIC|nr:myb domain protein 86 [Actinidia rufa]